MHQEGGEQLLTCSHVDHHDQVVDHLDEDDDALGDDQDDDHHDHVNAVASGKAAMMTMMMETKIIVLPNDSTQ